MESSVIVAVRVRPLTKREALNNLQCPIQIPKPGVVHVFEPNVKNNVNVREFQFDHTFWSLNDGSNHMPHASQELVYQTIGFPLLIRALEGYNACLFAYGMTSSGKTYSITGPPDDPGIIRRISKDVFEEIGRRTEPTTRFSVKMSYYEIYNERIRDLLSSNSTRNGLVVREHPVTGPYIDGLLCEEVWSESDIIKRLDFGNRLRAVAATSLNENSSRSHTVLVLSLMKRSTVNIDNMYSSHITVVDLAGSERQTSTSTLSGRFIESCQINKSLFTLGKRRAFPSPEPRSVVHDTCPLFSVTPCRLVNKRRDFVSYRDSLLTWLLKDSLGGNAVTVMLATVSPCQTHYDETLSTLRYAKKASSIINSAMVNEDPKSRLIRELMSELRILRQKASSIMFESGTCQAYEAAKLRELISIREEGVLQLRRYFLLIVSYTPHTFLSSFYS
ncbi:putative kif1 [Schistosoma mansoni]|uniref:putative kif1 n=1 Tax=Schistosoma mansoni TaxID=6183 RepID=UPI00022DC489|nr:putative kif1 [Schistosoma mansoni]|eukprot:XP_018649059.1 putative kif1 [Schistosoma mansoni]